MILGKQTIGTIAYMGGVMALPEPFVWSWGQMIQFNADYLQESNQTIFYDHVTASYHSYARNEMVKRMRGDWLLMLDTDHQFDPDLAARLLMRMNRHNIDILVAPYVYKSKPYSPVLFGYNPKTKNRFALGDWQKDVDVLPIHSAGAGCLLVKRTVFEKIREKFNCDPFDIYMHKGVTYSEDHSFFHRVHRLKLQAYFAPYVQFKHLVYRGLSLDDYQTKGLRIKREHSAIGFK